MVKSLRNHWPEYAIEAALLGGFMVSACGFGALLWYPGSVVAQQISDEFARRGLMGIAMGATAIALIYSPWGKRSGAHMNPAVTLTFLRLGKVSPRDAAFYIASHVMGGALGVFVMFAILGQALSHPTVNFVVTSPGAYGAGMAFAAEIAISFLMMFTVLFVSNTKAFANFTGVAAGILVMLYITFEAPISGMSMNPARSLGSAVVAQQWSAFWLYVVAPVLGMLLASEMYVRVNGVQGVACAKLHHHNQHRCIFCEYQHPEIFVATTRVAPIAQEGN